MSHVEQETFECFLCLKATSTFEKRNQPFSENSDEEKREEKCIAYQWGWSQHSYLKYSESLVSIPSVLFRIQNSCHIMFQYTIMHLHFTNELNNMVIVTLIDHFASAELKSVD